MVDCTQPTGALYCNGSYVDHGGALKDCINAIEADLPNVTVDVSATASGTSSCMGSSCQASGEASASASCAFSPIGAARSHGAYGAFAVLAALGAVCARRRKSR